MWTEVQTNVTNNWLNVSETQSLHIRNFGEQITFAELLTLKQMLLTIVVNCYIFFLFDQ